jgi:hypothetical protein
MRSLLTALAIADLAMAGLWAAVWLRERHRPAHQRVRSGPLTPLVIGIFVAQAVLFWFNATRI